MREHLKQVRCPDEDELIAMRELRKVAQGHEVDLQTLREVLAKVPHLLKTAPCRAAVRKVTSDGKEDLLHVLDEVGAICIEQGEVIKATLVEQDFELEPADVVEEVNHIASAAVAILATTASLPHNKLNEELRAASTAAAVIALLDSGAQPNYYGCYGSSPVHEAAYSSKPDCLRVLLERGGDKAARTSERRTPLHAAAIAGSKACIEILIKAGIDIQALDYCSMTALHFLARNAKGADCVALLLEAGADVNAKDSFGMTPLHYAAANGSEETVKILLNANASLEAVDCWYRTPGNMVYNECDSREHRQSRTAIYYLLNSVETIEDIMEDNVEELIWDDSDEDDFPGKKSKKKTRRFIKTMRHVSCVATAAHINKEQVRHVLNEGRGRHITYSACKALQKCAEEGRYDVLREFMVHGANPSARESDHWKDETYEVNNWTDPNWLSWDHDDWPLIHLAAAGGHMKAVEVLKEAGASLERVLVFDYPDPFGPLEAAAVHGKLIVMKMLLRFGCVADREQISGALRLAVTPEGWKHECEDWDENHRVKLARALLDAGADPNAQDVFGHTAILGAVFAGWSRCLGLLIHRGGDVSIQDRNGRTALHTAARQCRLQCIKMLIEAGADVSIKDASGQTPLHYLAEGRKDGKWAFTPWLRSGDVDCLKALVKAGADLEAVDYAGSTALHLAVIAPGSLAVVQELLCLGASVSARDRNGRTPLHCAANARMQSSVQLLLDAGADPEVKDHNGCTPRGDAKGSAVTLLRPGDSYDGDDWDDEIGSWSGDSDVIEPGEDFLSSPEDTVDDGDVSSEDDDSEEDAEFVYEDMDVVMESNIDSGKTHLNELLPSASCSPSENPTQVQNVKIELSEDGLESEQTQLAENKTAESKLCSEGLKEKVEPNEENCKSEQFQDNKEEICTNNLPGEIESRKDFENEQMNLKLDSKDFVGSSLSFPNVSEVRSEENIEVSDGESEREVDCIAYRLRSRDVGRCEYELSENELKRFENFKRIECYDNREFSFRRVKCSPTSSPNPLPKVRPNAKVRRLKYDARRSLSKWGGHCTGCARWVKGGELYGGGEDEKSTNNEERLRWESMLSEHYKHDQLTDRNQSASSNRQEYEREMPRCSVEAGPNGAENENCNRWNMAKEYNSKYGESSYSLLANRNELASSNCQEYEREMQRCSVGAGPNIAENENCNRWTMAQEHNSDYGESCHTLDRHTQTDPEFRRRLGHGSQYRQIVNDSCSIKSVLSNDSAWKRKCMSPSFTTHEKGRQSDDLQNEKTLTVMLKKERERCINDHRNDQRDPNGYIGKTELNVTDSIDEGHNQSHESEESVWERCVILETDQHKQDQDRMPEYQSAGECDVRDRQTFYGPSSSQDECMNYAEDTSHIREEEQNELDRPYLLGQLDDRMGQDDCYRQRELDGNEMFEKFGNASKISVALPFHPCKSRKNRKRESVWKRLSRKERPCESERLQGDLEKYGKKNQWNMDGNREECWNRTEGDYNIRYKDEGGSSSFDDRSGIHTLEKSEEWDNSEENEIITQNDNWDAKVHLDTQSGKRRLGTPNSKSNIRHNEYVERGMWTEQKEEQITNGNHGIHDYRRQNREPSMKGGELYGGDKDEKSMNNEERLRREYMLSKHYRHDPLTDRNQSARSNWQEYKREMQRCSVEAGPNGAENKNCNRWNMKQEHNSNYGESSYSLLANRNQLASSNWQEYEREMQRCSVEAGPNGAANENCNRWNMKKEHNSNYGESSYSFLANRNQLASSNWQEYEREMQRCSVEAGPNGAENENCSRWNMTQEHNSNYGELQIEEWDGSRTKNNEFDEQREEGRYESYSEREEGHFKKPNEQEYEKFHNPLNKSEERFYERPGSYYKVDEQLGNGSHRIPDCGREHRETKEWEAELDYERSRSQYNRSGEQLPERSSSFRKASLQEHFYEGDRLNFLQEDDRTKQGKYGRSGEPSREGSSWEELHSRGQYSEEQRSWNSTGGKETSERTKPESSSYRKRYTPYINMAREGSPKRFHRQF